MPRFHLSSELMGPGVPQHEFDLDSDSARKMVKVLRMTPGETFVGFDGFGREWDCALVSTDGLGRARARAVVLAERDVVNLRRISLCVGQAVPKNDKMDFVLQKGTELGVAEFWPFEGDRSVSRLDAEDEAGRGGVRAERWRRIVSASAAQCGRADVPIVHAIADFATAVDFGLGGSRCFLLDESAHAKPLRAALVDDPISFDGDDPPRVMLLVGPEGGWATREREWAERYGVEAVHLGARILRTETAALVAAAVLFWEAGEL